MKPIHACVALLLVLASSAVTATERTYTSTVKSVYPLANGDFVIILATDPPTCLVAGSPKYLHVAVGQNSMTAAGASKIFAAALSALVSGQSTSVVFDDATTQCYVNRISVAN